MAEKPLRATIEVPIGDDDVAVDINWRVIEQVERVFGVLADLVASDILVNYPTRHKVAEVIALWCAGPDHRRKDVIEEVMTADTKTLQRYIGAIQGAVLYVLRHVEKDQMEKLAAGEDLDDDERGDEPEQIDVEDEPKKGKGKTKGAKRSPDSATE